MRIKMERLDLHGVRHGDVRQEVIRFIESHWNSDETELEIVTGYSPSMKRIAGIVLDEYQLDYRVGDAIGVNKGFIRVTMP
jgi:hypothetical protein